LLRRQVKEYKMVTALSTYTSLLAQWGGYNWGMGPGMMGWGYGMGWLGPVFMIIILVAVVLLIVFLVRGISSSGGHGTHNPVTGDSALDILKKRYARGEINKDEFEEKKKDLDT
jgi:putative membrane protein